MCESTDSPFECGITCTNNDKMCAMFTSGCVGSGLALFVTGMLSPIEISGSFYSSMISGLVGGVSDALFIGNMVLYDVCVITKNVTLV